MGWVVNATPRPLYSQEKILVRTEYEAGLVPAPVWAVWRSENIVRCEIGTLDCPARSLVTILTDKFFHNCSTHPNPLVR